MSFEKLNKLASTLAQKFENSEKLATPILANKLAKYAEQYPHDYTIGAVLQILNKMASSNNLFISKTELKNLYNKLYSRNTKFAELMGNELGIQQYENNIKTYQRDDAAELNLYKGDEILSNALNSAFDKTVPLKTFSQENANKVKKSIANTLNSWNLSPNSIDVIDGNEKFLIVRADYETPKGLTSFYIPVELNKSAQAVIFVGNSGPLDFNFNNVKDYILKSAGITLKIKANTMLDLLTKNSNKELSNVELAVAKLNASRKEKTEFFADGIVGQKISTAAVKDVELPKYDEFISFEKQFTSPTGIAQFKFKNNVKTARDNIATELLSFGYKNPQIRVLNSNNNTIFYGVSLENGKVAFTVPVKIENNKINKPNVILCNGSIENFNKTTINKLYINDEADYKIAAEVSPMFELTPADIINNIKTAVAEENYAKAEDALNVLANSGDKKSYAIGFNAFMNSLNKTASQEKPSCCSMMVKNASSKHLICGHTGLPVNKVYQDKDGNCRPLYRKGMDETYDGAFFMTAKILG